uniref:Ubiquitin-like domain-containing protein n=1 Tax=Panagrolaimus sp. ES5 TaxID=591445 RepID=A0AC34GU70_9BILA
MSKMFSSATFTHVEWTIMNENGDILKVDIKKTRTFKYIRSKIQNVCRIPLNLQCFTCSGAKRSFTKDFTETEDDENVCDDFCNDEADESIYFTVKNKAGKFFMVEVNGNESIETLMLKIQETCAIPLNQQCFTCFDKTTLSDEFWKKEVDKFCNDIKECRQNVADMIAALKNYDLKNDGKAIDKNVSGNVKKEDAKTSESDLLEEPCEPSNYCSVQLLKAVNKLICLTDGSLNGSNKSHQKSILLDKITPKDLEFTIMNEQGDILKADVNVKNSIKIIRAKIDDICGIPFNRQCFTCSDNRTLSDEFWEKKYENLCNNFKDSHNFTTFYIPATVENPDFDFDIDSIHFDDIVEEKEVEILNNNKKKSDEIENYSYVKKMHAMNESVCKADGIVIDLKTTKLRFVLNDELHADQFSFPVSIYDRKKTDIKAVSFLIPKIVKCYLQLLELFNQNLSWSEYQFLTASGTIKNLNLTYCSIKYEDGSIVTVDKLLDNLGELVEFEIHRIEMSSLFERDTTEKFVEILLSLKNLQSFGFFGLKETFDISTFAYFAMKNSNVTVVLKFNLKQENLSDAYKEKLKNFLEKLVSTGSKKITVQFSGSKIVNHLGYQKLFDIIR